MYKNIGSLTLALCGLMIFTGCTYKVAPVSAPAVNVYSSYDTQIPGRWVLVSDDSMEDFRREVKPSSYECSAHKYPLEVGDSLSSSVASTLGRIFEEVEIRRTTPSLEELENDGALGYIVVRLDGLSPRLDCDSGFWSTNCIATMDMSLGIRVAGRDGALLGTSVGSRKTFDGDAGGACGKASDKLAESYKLALREVMERMAERVSNSSRIREYVEGS